MIRANTRLPHLQKVVEGFDVSDLKKWRAAWDTDLPLSIFTEKEFDLLQFSPSPLYTLNALYEFTFPLNKDHARRQLETDVIGQYAVLENSIRQQYYWHESSIDSRLRKLDSILCRAWEFGLKSTYWSAKFPSEEHIDTHEGIPTPTEAYGGYHPTTTKRMKNKLRFIYELKQTYSKLLQSQKIVDAQRKEMGNKQQHPEVDLVQKLQELFGKDIAVVLYGSATYQHEQPNDYDLLVLVDGLKEEMYQRLELSNIHHNNKPVDVVLVIIKEWEKFVVKNSFSLGIVKNGIILHGDAAFPALDSREGVLRGLSRAVSRIRMLHGLALNVAVHPQEFADKEGLYTSLAKMPRYILRSLLELRDLQQGLPHTQYPNRDMDTMLQEMKIERRSFPEDRTRIQESLFQVMVDTAKVVEAYYFPQWVGQYKSEIRKMNNPSKEFLSLVTSELEMEKNLRQAWELTS